MNADLRNIQFHDKRSVSPNHPNTQKMQVLMVNDSPPVVTEARDGLSPGTVGPGAAGHEVESKSMGTNMDPLYTADPTGLNSNEKSSVKDSNRNPDRRTIILPTSFV